LLLFAAGCAYTGRPLSGSDGERQFLGEVAQRIREQDYVNAVMRCQEYLSEHPQSEYGDVILMMMGESLEGLLRIEYLSEIEEKGSEPGARRRFLEKHGHFASWIEKKGKLAYNLGAYRQVMDRYPDSRYADEASYKLIPWRGDYGGRPEGLLEEIENLEAILQKYPTTTLRSKILYDTAYRCHILYEIYAFSPYKELRNSESAQKYYDKAFYMYQLALKEPQNAEVSKKCWEGMKELETGKKIYIRGF
jgi:hypothetical protein